MYMNGVPYGMSQPSSLRVAEVFLISLKCDYAFVILKGNVFTFFFGDTIQILDFSFFALRTIFCAD